MHPTIQYEITRARIADLQRRAGQDAIAHAARRGHRALILPRRYPCRGDLVLDGGMHREWSFR
jgi:hypothetical protein